MQWSIKHLSIITYIVATALILLVCLIAIFILPPILALVVLTPYLMFLPGSAIVFTFFPQKTRKSRMEAIILSIGLSLLVLVMGGLVLNIVSWGISAKSWMFFVGLFSFIVYGIGVIFGRQLPSMQTLQIDFSKLHIWQTVIPLLLLIPIIIIIFVAGIKFRTIRAEPLTQLSMLVDVQNNTTNLRLVIHNLEQHDVVYNIDVVMDEHVVEMLDAVSVKDGETLDHIITINSTSNVELVTIILYLDAEKEIEYRRVSYRFEKVQN